MEQLVLEGQSVDEIPKSGPYLRRLYEDDRFVLGTTSVRSIVLQAVGLFHGHIDPEFKDSGFRDSAAPPGRTEFALYGQARDGTFAQSFDSLERSYVELCSTERQIMEFSVKYRAWLRGAGYGNFFLLERTDGGFSVADVDARHAGHLQLKVYELSRANIWLARYQHRFIVPIPSALSL